MYEEGWSRGGINALSYAFTDYFTNHAANSTAAEFVARRRSARSSTTPTSPRRCAPDQHIGTKRTCVDIDYFETYNRDNVTLVDLRREPLQRITPARRADRRRPSTRSTASSSRSGSTP